MVPGEQLPDAVDLPRALAVAAAATTGTLIPRDLRPTENH